MKRALLLWGPPVLALGLACGRADPESHQAVVPARGAPTAANAPAPPTASPSPTWPPATATPVEMTSEQVLPVPTEAPTLTQSGTLAQSFDRAPEPTPASLHEQMERCLSFAAERYTATSYSPVSIVAHVTVRNSCDISFAGSETWVEVSAIPAHSGTAGRETGRFQSPIPPRGSAETLVQINDLRPDEETYRLEAKLWWASGGGRRPE